MPLGSFRLNSLSKYIASIISGWNIETTVYSSKSYYVGAVAPFGQDIYFKPDGTKFYVNDITNDRVYQYSLSTAWDVSTASYDSKSFFVSEGSGGGVTAAIGGISFKEDGTILFVMEQASDTVYQYSVS